MNSIYLSMFVITAIVIYEIFTVWSLKSENQENQKRIKALEEAIFDGQKDEFNESCVTVKYYGDPAICKPFIKEDPDLALELRACIPDNPAHRAILHPHNMFIFENMANVARGYVAKEGREKCTQ